MTCAQAALVAVMHDAATGTPVPDRHVERVEHDLGRETLGHGPAHDAPAEDVEHDRDVEEAGPRVHVRDVGDPRLVGRGGSEVARHQVGGWSHARRSLRGHREAAPVHASEPALAHEAGDALARAAHATIAQLSVHAGDAVRLAAVTVDRCDQRAETLVLERVC